MSIQINECPICLDAIDFTTVSNRVPTECGQTFHCNCLMQNCAHNGFGCPNCRTAMATTPEEEESEFDDEEEEEEEEERFSDYALQGFRFFFNNLFNEEHNEEDILEDVEEPEAPKPTAAFVTERLVAQGITMESLVKILLLDHDEYDAEEEEFDRMSDDVWGKMRIIISNYQPEQAQAPVEAPTLVEATTPQPAEPKTQTPIRRREMMCHV